METEGKAPHLSCSDTIAVLKQHNMCQCYQTKHPSQCSQLNREHQGKNQDLKWNISSQQSFFTKNENETAAKVSFWVARLLAKQEKLVTNGELIKSYLIAADEEVCPEK